MNKKRIISLNKAKVPHNMNISQNKTTISLNTLKNISISNQNIKITDNKSVSSSDSSNNSSSLFQTTIGNQNKLRFHLNLQKVNPYRTISTTSNSNSFRGTKHSIFSRFQNNFRKTFNEKLDKQIKDMTKIMITINPSLVKQCKKKEKKQENINPNQIQKEEGEEELEEEEEDSEDKPKTITYTEPSIIDYNKTLTHKRIRNFKKYMNDEYIKNSKWKLTEGLIRQEVKIHVVLLKDKEFQASVIRDELKILIENIQYFKSNLLGTGDILSAFKNKDLNFQITTNKLLEETCAFINIIPKYILSDYYDYSERFISVQGGTIDDFISKCVTNEADIFIVNIKLLVKLAQFLKCSFEVYLMLIDKVDDITLKPQRFETLRLILEKCRYNISEIILKGKTSIQDLRFDRNLIKKYKPLLSKDVITARDIEIAQKGKQQKLSDHLRNQIQFSKNEFTQKKMRIINALAEEKIDNEDDNIIPFSKARPQKLKNLTGFHGPMALVKSHLMTKMLKYCKKDVREKIISLRTIERYQKQAAQND